MVGKFEHNTLYDSVVRITDDYLGPAADRFVSRQIRNHLQKEPNQLAKRDLASLIDWIRIAMSLITDDDNLVNNYIEALEDLTNGKVRNVSSAKKQSS